MKLNDKQRKVILIIMYIFIIVFLCYSIYNDLFTGEVLTIIGVFFLVICKKIYPDENIMKCFNTEIEVYNLKNSDIDSFLENIKDRYLLYEEMTDDFINVSVKKYLKVSGLDFFVKNKILVVIEASKLTLNVIDLIERIKNEYKENIPKFNIINQFFTDRFDLLIISDEVDEGLLHYLNSEVLSTVMYKGECIKCFSIPIVINKKANKLYLAGFNSDSYSKVVYYSQARKKIRNKFKSNKII